MKIASDVVISRIDDPATGKHAVTLDLTNDLFTDTHEFLGLLESFREYYIHKPIGIWLNINQAYVLAFEEVKNTGRPVTRENAEDLAHKLETFMGYRIWIKGRDA